MAIPLGMVALLDSSLNGGLFLLHRTLPLRPRRRRHQAPRKYIPMACTGL